MELFIKTSAVCLLLTFIFALLSKKKTFGKKILFFLTAEYAGVILMLTLLRRVGRGGTFVNYGYGFDLGGIYSPRQTVYVLLNFLLFIPWGILISRHVGKATKSRLLMILLVTVLCFATSFCIESMQLFTGKGYFEKADLVTNTLGGLTGSVIGSFFVRENI
ncbi:MAG: VanZ family protein [Butyrivibrio sp.]|nr:VanZ family protein [Butyrivibrio sp.]